MHSKISIGVSADCIVCEIREHACVAPACARRGKPWSRGCRWGVWSFRNICRQRARHELIPEDRFFLASSKLHWSNLGRKCKSPRFLTGPEFIGNKITEKNNSITFILARQLTTILFIDLSTVKKTFIIFSYNPEKKLCAEPSQMCYRSNCTTSPN